MPALTDMTDHSATPGDGCDEAARLAALRDHEILDTPPEEQFDDLVRLAAQVCGTPIAAISLVDEHRQWFKAITGLDVTETPREVAFCAHTVLQADLMTVPNAEADARFADNPLVTGDPGIRFYAGIPLVTEDGHALGSLCVIDRTVRTLTPEQEATLRLLASQAVSHLKAARRLAERERLAAQKERLAAIIENSDDAIYSKTLDGTLTSWNGGAERLYGYSAEEVLGAYVGILVPHDRQEELSRIMAAVRRGDTIAPLETVRQTRAGTRVDVSLRVSSIKDAAGTVLGAFMIARDVTERKRVEEALAKSQARMAEAQRVAKIGSWEYDIALGQITWSRELFRLVGRDEALGEPDYGAYLAQYHPEDAATLAALVSRAIAHGENYEIDLRLADGSKGRPPQWRHTVGRVAWGEDGQVVRLSGTVADITERKQDEERLRAYAVVLEFQKNELEKANAALEELATTDGLTGLSNHRAFQERLAEEVGRAARYGTPLSVILLDVDHFKQYNDAFGHPVGDEVLKAVARVLGQNAREADIVARYGGEEFVLILPQTNLDGAAQIAERLRAAVEGHEWPKRAVTASFGVADLRLGEQSGTNLIARADGALYESKRTGRNRVTWDMVAPLPVP